MVLFKKCKFIYSYCSHDNHCDRNRKYDLKEKTIIYQQNKQLSINLRIAIRWNIKQVLLIKAFVMQIELRNITKS